MTGLSAGAPTDATTVRALTVAAVLGALAGMLLLATQPIGQGLDYGVGLVPSVVPWAALFLSSTLALIAPNPRQVTSPWGSVLIGGVLLTAAWSVAFLPFDLLRVVGLIPLPVSESGLALRVLLLVSATGSLVPALAIRRDQLARCPDCHRVLPGPLDRVPRWPILVALVCSLVYPGLRVTWVLGGLFGTTGEPQDVDPALALGLAAIGAVLVAFTVLLLIGRGPLWARALFGLGGVLAGLALAVNGGLAASLAVTIILREGAQSSPGSSLPAWTFLLVYGSWFLTGLGVIAGSWRYWARRREDCPACAPLLAT